MKALIIACIRWYQHQQTSLHARCRFEPTCSEYMILAIEKYGLARGVWKGVHRVLRCKPPHGGIDYP